MADKRIELQGFSGRAVLRSGFGPLKPVRLNRTLTRRPGQAGKTLGDWHQSAWFRTRVIGRFRTLYEGFNGASDSNNYRLNFV